MSKGVGMDVEQQGRCPIAPHLSHPVCFQTLHNVFRRKYSSTQMDCM
jgi:hypothetical protein